MTLLARELCEEFLAEPEPLLRSAAAPGAVVTSGPAYLEPGLTAYLRYARMLRRERSRGAPIQRRT